MARIGTALRSARERAGWSREALAYHSGLSVGAIAQIESGRRQEVRLGSLVAFANALGVSVDYLVGSESTVSPKLLGHSALLYGSDDEYLASAAPFVLEGMEHGDCILAITASRRIGLLRDALGPDASLVEFRDSADWYRTPIGALNLYRALIRDRFEQGAHWIRVIGEPIWAGRSETQVVEWTRYEAILNISLASSPATIMCPYDTRTVSDEIIARAYHTHPEVTEVGNATTSRAYQEPEELLISLT
jgi:transcriptional regulator with XRE-family HTH domain